MNKLIFYKRILNTKYICMFDVLSENVYETSSKGDYSEAGKEMIKVLGKNLSEEITKEPLYLSRLTIPVEGIENPREAELYSIKKSLDTFIQDNKLNIKLEIEKKIK